ncbi:MAG TPA: hypothetical protein VMW76_01840 [Bacteroidales bacterium]|nr:hypothetical protein [Bacteroidales bacterium]
MAKDVTEKSPGKPGIDNPFPGLRPFTPAESHLFFGREGQSDEILIKLKKNRFVTIIGSSGSGKSSLIYCGIIPRLQRESIESGVNWKVLSMRPGNDPVGNMIQMFLNGNDNQVIDEGKRSEIKSLLKADPDGLLKTIRQVKASSSEKVLILVDQFEELFRFSSTRREGAARNESRNFVNQIVNAVNKSDEGINIIITMRSDFIGECAHFQGLTDLINNSNYLVPHMATENYRQAIVGPVEYAGANIEPELVETLLLEIGERTDQLPVLQHALMRTWSHWQSMKHPDTPVSATNYDAVGQMAEAMSRHANEAYEELDARGKEICEVLFKTITEKGSDNKGIRHPTKVKTISAIARCSVEELQQVINVFRQAGRSFLTPGTGIDLDAESVIDVSHESLMRLWSRLSEWVDEEASSVQMYLRLSEAAEMFQEGRTTLWRPPDLQLALNWRNDNMPTLTWAERFNPAFERAMVYLRTSEKEFHTEEENKIRAQKRQLRRSRITAMILGTAAIISVFFMLYAFVKQMEAARNFERAEAETQRATLQQGIAEAQADTARINADRAALNQRLAELNRDTAEINAEEARRQELLAIESALEALNNAELAQRNAVIANANKDTAVMNEQRAILQEREATRLRMVSIGKQMAVKSIQVTGQGDLQALLSYQAYKFNSRNMGTPNDADIYMGLYNVAKKFGGANYKTFEGHTGSVKSITFNPGQSVFFTSGVDGKVYRWDSGNEGNPQTVFEGNEIMEVISSSPDGRLLACGSDRAAIRIFPPAGGVAYELQGHTGKIKSLVFSPDGNYLYSSSLDGQVLIWNVETRQSEQLLTGENDVISLDISRSGRFLAGAFDNGTICVWDLGDGTSPDTVPSNNGEVDVLRFTDDNLLAIGHRNGMIELYDVENSVLKNELNGHNARVSDIRFNKSLDQMATSSTDGSVKIWNMTDLTEPPIAFNDNNGFVLALAFSPDGKLLISGTNSEEGNLVARPSHADYMVQDICSILTRNFTQDEWDRYVARDIEWEETCNSQELSIKVQEKKGN